MYYELSDKPAAGVKIPHRDRAYPNQIPAEERAAVVDRLNQSDTEDLAIRQAYFHLLDGGEYLCSMRSMHRIMHQVGQSGDRRRRHHQEGYHRHHTPQVAATAPRQAWCWDITDLSGPGRQQFKLFSMIDLYSRKVVAHRIERSQTKELGTAFVEQAIAQEQCHPRVIHADNGGAMRSGSMHELLQLLHITESHSRPRVSNDNPHAEALFSTVKRDRLYPDRFDSLHHARHWAQEFFNHYNTNHHHSGLAGHTPERIHDGSWPTHHQIWTDAKAAYAAKHPHRQRRAPITHQPPDIVWINKPNHDLSKTG